MRTIISLIMLSFILPRVAICCLSAWRREQKIKLFTKAVLGYEMRRLTMRRVMVANKPLPDFDKWFHYLRGNLDLIGPKAIAANSLSTLEKQHRARFKVAPGIFSPYRAKRAAGIAYQSEPETAVDFVKNDSKLRRFSLLIVCVLGRLVRVDDSKLSTLDHFFLFGVRINNVTMRDAVNNIMLSMDKSRKQMGTKLSSPAQYAFVNADCANKYYTDDHYRTLLNKFSGVFADGVGVKIAARLSGLRMKENVNGTDMFPLLCEQLDKSTKRVFLLGAKPKVVEKVANKLAREYPNIVVADYVDGFSYQNDQLSLRQRINRAKADILFVAMGAPRQEQWIEANALTLNVAAMIGVGGLFDFYSDTVSRAPIWLRELSLEWLWRFAMQPMDKAKRYLVGNPLFLFRVLINRNAQKPQELTLETS